MAAKPWVNLSMQTVQPLFQVAERVRVELVVNAKRTAVRLSTLHAAVSPNSAFEGGCCLRIQGGVLSDCCSAVQVSANSANVLQKCGEGVKMV